MTAVSGRRLWVFGHVGRAYGLICAVLREVFDQAAWQRFSGRKGSATFKDFLRERHDRPRQRCC